MAGLEARVNRLERSLGAGGFDIAKAMLAVDRRNPSPPRHTEAQLREMAKAEGPEGSIARAELRVGFYIGGAADGTASVRPNQETLTP